MVTQTFQRYSTTIRSNHSFIPAIFIAPLQVLYYSEVLPTTARILYRSFTPKLTGKCLVYVGCCGRSSHVCVPMGFGGTWSDTPNTLKDFRGINRVVIYLDQNQQQVVRDVSVVMNGDLSLSDQVNSLWMSSAAFICCRCRSVGKICHLVAWKDSYIPSMASIWFEIWGRGSGLENWGAWILKVQQMEARSTWLRVSSPVFYLIIHKLFYFWKVSILESVLISDSCTL